MMLNAFRSIPYRAWLLIIIVAVVIVLGINPHSHGDYLLEHTPTLALIIFLYVYDRKWTLSNTSATLIFIFLLFHALGAHFLYSRVPYDEWTRNLFGQSLGGALGFSRNHYDRLVHFLFGILMVYPVREVALRYFRLGPGAGLVLAILFIAFFSKTYELIEWFLSIVLHAEAAENYNGQQGDIFDAQKDMGLALLGSIITATFLALRERIKP